MDLQVRESQYGQGDQSWLGSAHGVDTGEPIELDLSLFDFVADFPDGYLPSGITLGKVTATGQYGPYDDAAVDGRTGMVGHLLFEVAVKADNTGGVALGALLRHGKVVVAKLPANHGLDANGRANVAGSILYID